MVNVLLILAALHVHGCQSNPKHLGWQTHTWQGGNYDRPHCVLNGRVVWCDEYCGRHHPAK